MKVLLVGTPDSQKDIFNNINVEEKSDSISTIEEFEKLLTDYNGPAYTYIAVGNLLTGISAPELAQGLRSLFAQSRIVYITDEKKGYSRSASIKNGFDETFLLPNDRSIFKKELSDFFNFSKNQEKLKPVRLIDIKAGEMLDFNIYVYLVKNKKYILYNKAQEPIDLDRLKRLVKFHLDVVFVPESQLKSFYKYSSKKLKDIYKEAHKIGQTEKIEILQREVRGLFHSIFEDRPATDFDFGKEVLNDCKQIVALFVSGSNANWHDTMLSSISIDEFDPYSHSVHVSIFASLIAMGLGMQNVEDYALAGLFHDVGLEDNSKLFLVYNIHDLTGQDSIAYELHPQNSLTILKEKRIILNSIVQKMIEQHHENCLGTGFPNQLPPDKFAQESQILAIANEIDKRTRHELNEDKKTPVEIIDDLISRRIYDISLLKKIRGLFDNSKL